MPEVDPEHQRLWVQSRQRSLWHVLYALGAAAIVASFALPWWAGEEPLRLENLWTRVVLAGGISMLIAVVAAYLRVSLETRWAALILTGIVGFALLVFVARVGERGGLGAPAPFTPNIEAGFFFAAAGWSWAVLAGLALLLSDRPSRWMAPTIAFLAATGAVFLLYEAVMSNAERLSGPSPPEPIPEATTGPRRPTRKGT